MGVRNIPQKQAIDLAELIACRPGQVSSRGLSTLDSPCDMTLFAFAEGESVSEEIYATDMLYLAVEGKPTIVFSDGRVEMSTGQMVVAPAGVSHVVEGAGAFKVLQIAIP